MAAIPLAFFFFLLKKKVCVQSLSKSIFEKLSLKRLSAISNLNENKARKKFSALIDVKPETAVSKTLTFLVVDTSCRFDMLFDYSLDEVEGKIVSVFIGPDGSGTGSKVIAKRYCQAQLR